jgi:hypothetical protein
METTYIVISEQGREEGRTTGQIIKVDQHGTFAIGDLNFSSGMNKGLESEAVSALVNLKELPEVAISKSGYVNHEFKEHRYKLVLIEGRGITYYSIH